MQIEYNLFVHFKFIQIQRNLARKSNAILDLCPWSLLAINHCFEFELQFSRCKSCVKIHSSRLHVIQCQAFTLRQIIDLKYLFAT